MSRHRQQGALTTLLLVVTAVLAAGAAALWGSWSWWGSPQPGNGNGGEPPEEELRLFSDSGDILSMRLHWEGAERIDLIYSSQADCNWSNPGQCADYGVRSSLEGGEVRLNAIENGERAFDADKTWYFVAEAGGERTDPVSARTGSPEFDGLVRALGADDERLYLGGDFQRIGIRSSGLAALDPETGGQVGPLTQVDQLITLDGGQILPGTRIIVEDEEGGWFVGGLFMSMAGFNQPGLVRLTPDGQVDRDWEVELNGPVETLLVDNGRLYVGGRFTLVNGEPREGLAAFDLAQEGALADWSVDFQWGNQLNVDHIVAFNDQLFLAGEFTRVNGEPRSGLASVDHHGEVTDWAPQVAGGAPGLVLDMTAAQGRVFVTGFFPTAGGEPRQGLAAFDSEGEGLLVDHWAPEMPQGSVGLSLLALGNELYVGAGFLDGRPAGFVRAFDLSSGDQTWQAALANEGGPMPDALNTSAQTLAADDGRLYVGGWFNRVNGSERRNIAAFDRTQGMELVDWTPGADSIVSHIHVASDRVWLTGAFNLAGGHERAHVAAMSVADGRLDPDWTPLVDGPVRGLSVWADNDNVDEVRLIGDFALALGADGDDAAVAVDGTVGFSRETASIRDGDWAAGPPTLDGPVHALTHGAERAFIGGAFDEALKDLWLSGDGYGVVDYERTAPVTALAFDHTRDRLLVGGAFGDAPGQGVVGFPAAPGSDGQPDWSDNGGDFQGQVGTLLFDAQRDWVIAAGEFMIDGPDGLDRMAALNADSGGIVSNLALPSWDGAVNALSLSGDRLFVGGQFRQFLEGPREQPAPRPKVHLAEVDLSNPEATQVTEWSPSPNGPVLALTAFDSDDSRLAVSGMFSDIAGRYRKGFAVFDENGELLW